MCFFCQAKAKAKSKAKANAKDTYGSFNLIFFLQGTKSNLLIQPSCQEPKAKPGPKPSQASSLLHEACAIYQEGYPILSPKYRVKLRFKPVCP